MKKVLSVIAILFLISACTTRTTHLSVVVPKGNQFAASDLNTAVVHRKVTASDTSPILLFFPLGFPNFYNALESALDSGKGNAMTNVTVVDELNWFLLFGWNKITVSGDVVDVR